MITSLNKILFLDYDGVLHRDAVYREHRRPVLRGHGILFEWSGPLIDALAPHPEVKIVLSTSWSRVLGFSRARSALPPLLRERVVGATWHSAMSKNQITGFRVTTTWWDKVSRYRQIAAYVARGKIQNWLAIDDDGLDWPKEERDHLVWTDPERGLSDPSIEAELRWKLGLLSQAV